MAGWVRFSDVVYMEGDVVYCFEKKTTPLSKLVGQPPGWMCEWLKSSGTIA
jgi:hypothetical protein